MGGEAAARLLVAVRRGGVVDLQAADDVRR